MTTFLPGLELAERFYREAVLPILDRRFPGLAHSAALLGQGSDVLGYDDATSTDHGWGPRVELFLGEADYARLASPLRRALGHELPVRFLGWSTHWTRHADGSLVLEPRERGPVRHRIDVVTPGAFFEACIGADPARPLAAGDWLVMPQSALRSLACGRIFRDDLGLEDYRRRLAWYPRDVWLYLLAASWTRIAQAEPFVGRAGSTGDDLGSRLVAAGLVRDAMSLAFLLERRYAPYAKWFGRAFGELGCARSLGPRLERALDTDDWRERERMLAETGAALARVQNDLGLVAPVSPEPRPFYERPFVVIGGGRLARALLDAVEAPDVRRLAGRPPVGSVDQLSDSTDLLAPAWRDGLRALYASA